MKYYISLFLIMLSKVAFSGVIVAGLDTKLQAYLHDGMLAKQAVIAVNVEPITNFEMLNNDSVKNILLQAKSNDLVKNSFLQEYYIRNVIVEKKDSLELILPFNLHGIDCGAPDCYTTELRIQLPIGQVILFPKKLIFTEKEMGCVEKESNLKGVMNLIAANEHYIMYGNAQYKKLLFLAKSNDKYSSLAYYFSDYNWMLKSKAAILQDVSKFDEGKSQAVDPYTSTVLSTKDYTLFISQ